MNKRMARVFGMLLFTVVAVFLIFFTGGEIRREWTGENRVQETPAWIAASIECTDKILSERKVETREIVGEAREQPSRWQIFGLGVAQIVLSLIVIFTVARRIVRSLPDESDKARI